jgi:hypothetical protein
MPARMGTSGVVEPSGGAATAAGGGGGGSTASERAGLPPAAGTTEHVDEAGSEAPMLAADADEAHTGGRAMAPAAESGSARTT